MNPQENAGDKKQKQRKIPKKIYIFGALMLIASGLYISSFIIPRQVSFSYLSDNCRNETTLLPKQYKFHSDGVDVDIKYTESLGGAIATKTCFYPQEAPKAGSFAVKSSLFGFAPFTVNYRLKIDEPPKVVGSLTTKPIAIKRPVIFDMDKPDRIFEYSLVANDKKQTCKPHDDTIECGINQLGFKQGESHKVELVRSFKGQDPQKVTEREVIILPATNITDSSIKKDETVYGKPKEISLTTDKPVVKATGKLESIEGDQTSEILTEITTKDSSITLKVTEDLPREKSYRLTIDDVETNNGSSLNEPYVVPFSTSGGPKVTGTNIAGSGVDPGAHIVVSLDQNIAGHVNIADFAKIEGANATITKQGSQVIFALNGVARCTPFTIKINKGLTSEANGLVSKNDWSFASRTNCRTTSVIGYSVGGRPIVAYYYGSGSKTILFTGGIHGSEPSGTATMQGWVAHLDANAHKIPADKQVVIVPNLNPDGIAAGTRFNARNVNLGRNFPTANWKSDINTTSGLIKGGGGSSPLSEPESRAIANLTSQLRPRLEVSFHAQGSLVGANLYGDSESIGNTYARTVGYQTMFHGTEDIMGELTGEYEMWMAEKLGSPAILIELPSRYGNYFSSQQNALWKMVNI